MVKVNRALLHSLSCKDKIALQKEQLPLVIQLIEITISTIFSFQVNEGNNLFIPNVSILTLFKSMFSFQNVTESGKLTSLYSLVVFLTRPCIQTTGITRMLLLLNRNSRIFLLIWENVTFLLLGDWHATAVGKIII